MDVAAPGGPDDVVHPGHGCDPLRHALDGSAYADAHLPGRGQSDGHRIDDRPKPHAAVAISRSARCLAAGVDRPDTSASLANGVRRRAAVAR